MHVNCFYFLKVFKYVTIPLPFQIFKFILLSHNKSWLPQCFSNQGSHKPHLHLEEEVSVWAHHWTALISRSYSLALGVRTCDSTHLPQPQWAGNIFTIPTQPCPTASGTNGATHPTYTWRKNDHPAIGPTWTRRKSEPWTPPAPIGISHRPHLHWLENEKPTEAHVPLPAIVGRDV